ncbi:Clp protease N-terminal domain-containing protein [Nocardia sp. NPDC059240]|uniref:Clp protease N-terminal domain-containing protein n=1 Tax=Nocardia sp. NPDC059240 TaxID=3346786 RepID=UPI00369FC70B
MFERFNDAARRAVVLAQQEARLLGHDRIGTEHLLLGLIHGADPVAGQTLAELGLDLSGTREAVGHAVGISAAQVTDEGMPFTPRVGTVFEHSLREALHLGHNYIGPEHLLLGLVADDAGVATQVLISQRADPKDIRDRVLAHLQAVPPHTETRNSTESELRQRISELELRVAELERRLDGPNPARDDTA